MHFISERKPIWCVYLCVNNVAGLYYEWAGKSEWVGKRNQIVIITNKQFWGAVFLVELLDFTNRYIVYLLCCSWFCHSSPFDLSKWKMLNAMMLLWIEYRIKLDRMVCIVSLRVCLCVCVWVHFIGNADKIEDCTVASCKWTINYNYCK